MARPRFLADHDLNDQIVSGVLRREPLVEFVRARDVQPDGRPDDEVLEYGATNELIVVTHDVTTMSDAAYQRIGSGRPMAGLCLVRQRAQVAPVIDTVILIWAASDGEEWQGRVQYLPW